MMLRYIADYRDAITVALNRLALELGAAQEVFVPLAGFITEALARAAI